MAIPRKQSNHPTGNLTISHEMPGRSVLALGQAGTLLPVEYRLKQTKPGRQLADLLVRQGPLPAVGTWTELVAEAERHRVHLFLEHRLRKLQITPPPEAARELQLGRLAWLAKKRAWMEALDRVAETAGMTSTPVIVMKGPQLVDRLPYPPETRTFRDLDLLVPPQDFERFFKGLKAANFEITPGPYSDVSTSEIIRWELPLTLSPKERPGIHLDIHLSPINRLEAFYVSPEGFWERSVPWRGALRQFSDADFLLLLFIHGMKHGYFDLLHFLDLEMASRDRPLRRALPQVLRQAGAEGFESLISGALAMGKELLGTDWGIAERSGRGICLLKRFTARPALEARPLVSERFQILFIHPLLLDNWSKRIQHLRTSLLRPAGTIPDTPYKSGWFTNPWGGLVRLVRYLRRRRA